MVDFGRSAGRERFSPHAFGIAAGAALAVWAVLAPLASLAAREPVEAPKSIGLIERARSDIALIQVMVDGPDRAIQALTAEEFRLVVDGTEVELIAADNQCRLAEAEKAEDDRPTGSSPAPISYLFYFDQHNLTVGGRQNSIDIAKEMVAELVRDGNRATIVSAGQQLVTFAEFTSDAALLADALERLREDRTQWDEYSSLEPHRHRDVRQQARTSAAAGCACARAYQREETRRTENALELFSAVLGRFLNEDPPKLAFYFGDTLRVQSGRHYAAAVCGCELGSFDSLGAFQGAVRAAAAFGVRIYAVQAAGLVHSNWWTLRTASRVAEQHAQDGLKALTLDTGGDAFLGGASTKKMVRRIRADSDCLYVLSFDPRPFPQDRPLPVRVGVDRAEVKARSRSQVVFLSDSARQTATLLAAFTSPESVKDRLPMTGAVVPLELRDGRFRALVQAYVPGSVLPIGGEWDLGMSLMLGRSNHEEASGRIAVDRPEVPLVLETESAFRPGPYEVRLVGHETGSGLVAAGRIAGEWPDIEESPVITEIALLQPAAGAFLRGGELRTGGSLVVPPGRIVRAALPTALISLVCRGERRRKPLTVERSLTGASVVDFEPMELALDKEACVQVRDMIPENTMTSGAFTYTVRVRGADTARAREFVVSGLEPAERAPTAASHAPDGQE